jgi:hypothetical protein
MSTAAVTLNSFNRTGLANGLGFGSNISQIGNHALISLNGDITTSVNELRDLLNDRCTNGLDFSPTLFNVRTSTANKRVNVEVVIKKPDRKEALGFKATIFGRQTTISYGPGIQTGDSPIAFTNPKMPASVPNMKLNDAFIQFKQFLADNESLIAKWDAEAAETEAKALTSGQPVPNFLARRVLLADPNLTLDGFGVDELVSIIGSGLVVSRNGAPNKFDVNLKL